MKIRKKKNKLIVMLLLLLLFITLILFVYGLIKYLNPKLSGFEILKIEEKKNKLYLDVTKSNNAIKYQVIVYDIDNNEIYNTSSKTEKIDITNLVVDYNTKLLFKVTAFNRKNEKIESKNTFEYTNKYASFMRIKDHYAKVNEDITLFITGNYEEEKYYVELFYNNKKIITKNDITNKVIFNYDEIKDCEGKITTKLYNNKKRVVSIFNFYLNAPEVSEFKIIGPSNDTNLSYDDINIYYTGGDNATTLKVKIYNHNKKKLLMIMSKPFTSNNITLPAHLFKENTSYNIEILASYQDYEEIAKKDEIRINILQKETVSPVYVDKNFTFIKRGTQVSLKTDTEGATIYYTLDNSKPNSSSFIYSKPIPINTNAKIKAIAVKSNMYDSVLNTYEFKIKDKVPVIYLSPSNQLHNYGVSSTGFTNEKEMMNKLTDYLYIYLKEAGFKVHRNNKQSGGMNYWLSESNYYKSDFHFAIHSNGSTNHDTKGMEMYVNSPTSQCLSIASNIYNNLYEIYPYKDEVSNRGVKYANGSLGEANDQFIKCGALIEVAYHDNEDDARWIMENMETIARNIADTIISFYGLNE